MLLYKELCQKLDYLEPDKLEQINQAYSIALSYHSGQKRKSGEEYIMHPLSVAGILADMRVDYQSIIAALLHDVIEDTSATKKDIVAQFGQTIADIVDGVTKLTKIEVADKDETQAQNFHKMVLAMSKDLRVILIKLADRLHNMRTVSSLRRFKQRRIAKETLDIYAPIANRLGIYKIYVELEDLSFAVLYPRRFAILTRSVDQIYGKHKEVASDIEKELNEAFAESTLKNIKILGRTKHLYGIYRKMLVRKRPLSSIMDVYAFRVIVQNESDCYRALGVIHDLYKPLPGTFKDYIASPKFNSYKSLHTVLLGPDGVPIELQIRTQSMDQAANHGIAAHWLYRSKDQAVSAVHMQAQKWVSSLLEMQQNASSSSEFFESVKIDLFPDKVYVFTPKGNIMELTRGSTVIDFAYAIHTDIGDSCVAARVDRKFAPLSTILSNGQTVSIVTSTRANPNPAWLSFVATSRARIGIRQCLRNKKKEELVVLGRQLFDKAFSDLAFDSQKISPKILTAFVKRSGFKDIDELYEDIGLGNRLANLLVCQLINSNSADGKIVENKDSRPLPICGADGVAITFADCCYPIPGDAIVGYFGNNCGLEIHRSDCASLTKLCRNPEKCLLVSWAEDISNDFRVVLKVNLADKRGALAKITQALVKLKTNIDDISICGRGDGYVLLLLRLLVRNNSHLERVERYIRNIDEVASVVRESKESKVKSEPI